LEKRFPKAFDCVWMDAMHSLLRLSRAAVRALPVLLAVQTVVVLLFLLPGASAQAVGAQHTPEHRNGATAQATRLAAPQETGFLNRTIEINGVTYRFQVYLPEDYRKPDEERERRHWPVILFLHGRGERGSEGMWQTQVGLPAQVRDHPERWPFVIVMPQCSLHHFWTDPEMLQMATAALSQEEREFHTDPDRTYLSGLSLGGYGAWELAKENPHRWAAIAIAASGIFWSYAPERWKDTATLPGEYARQIGRTPVWLFHGSEDTTVVPRQSELMFEALKAESGHVRLWIYQGLKHDCWTRAYDEPELPRWLLSHHLNAQGVPVHDPQLMGQGTGQTTHVQDSPLPPLAERIVVPLHPPEMKLATAVLDGYVGEYRDSNNIPVATIQRQGEELYLRNTQGDAQEIEPESYSTFFLPAGGLTRIIFEHDAQGKIVALIYRDDRHEERWEKRK
jgi:acetyl esterase/lipase